MKKAKSGEIVRKSRGSTKAVLFSALPVHECLMAENMLETGLGSVWISRKLPNGKLAVGVFLLDIFCLGVKNAMLWEKMPQRQYEVMQAMSLGETLVPVKPCCATKLIVEAADYAESLGFRPHEDYATAGAVLEGIETAGCETDYEFGQDGRPLYIPGPDESPKIMARIIEQLRKHCGEDGFDIMTEEDVEDEEGEYVVTIDNPEKTGRLMDGLQRSLPFKAMFEEKGWQQLVKEGRVPHGAAPSMTVEKLSYSGDFGGILCHLAEHSLVCSLTHLRFDPAFALYRDIVAYQKLRVKKLKKQTAAA